MSEEMQMEGYPRAAAPSCSDAGSAPEPGEPGRCVFDAEDVRLAGFCQTEPAFRCDQNDRSHDQLEGRPQVGYVGKDIGPGRLHLHASKPVILLWAFSSTATAAKRRNPMI